MSEGNVFYCVVEQKKKSVTLKLFKDSQFEVYGHDLDSAIDNMQLKILNELGDSEAIIEVIDTNNTSHVVVSYNDGVKAINSIKELYSGGICCKCEHPIGERNNTLLDIKSIPDFDVAGVDAPLPVFTIFSRKFIDQLPAESLGGFQVNKVLHAGEDSGYVELIGENLIEAVGIKGASYPSIFHQSWECSECGRRSFVVSIDGKSQSCIYLDAEKYSKINSEIFQALGGIRNEYLILKKIWVNIVKDHKLKGLVSDEVRLLEWDKIDIPVLSQPEKFEW